MLVVVVNTTFRTVFVCVCLLSHTSSVIHILYADDADVDMGLDAYFAQYLKTAAKAKSFDSSGRTPDLGGV